MDNAGEALSSRRKRQRLIFMDNTDDDMIHTGTLLELDLLDCPICCHPLTSPIFQCVNGHLVCSSCHPKLRNKCPSCSLTIGNNRSRIAERLLEAVLVPCRNAKHGCPERYPHGKELADHEKICDLYVCYCPAKNCNHSAFQLDLYCHYTACHKASCSRYKTGQYADAWLNIEEKVLVLQECDNEELLVLQCFKGAHGLYVAVNLMTYSVPDVWELGYDLIYRWGNEEFTYETDEMTKIQRINAR
ncbi:E3 ubiquitin-protein ligase SINA-like 2 [Capsella rubella]|uniref:E3 ubiquitin-protein ligase SINA-like 2 n=1 Tax=Capsella rubella TaxID=81985 RepID=UPI000CD534B1|nr:E3 ubiquitin-protein ligase SINA-like 2 [Capsella rubella]